MNFLFILIVISVFPLCAILAYYRPVLAGLWGEAKVSSILAMLSKKHYRVYNDLIVPVFNHTAQIDYIVVSNYGVFVIETKNYKGKIYGGENSEYWTQNIFGNKFNLYNPILQNAKHVKTLCLNVKGITADICYPVIVFTGESDLRVKTTTPVIKLWKLYFYIKKHKNIVLTDSQIADICYKLDTLKENKIKKSEHKEFVKETASRTETFIRSGVCPRCKGDLVLRHGKYGDFWGCSNYPKCTFIQKDKVMVHD